MTPDERRRAHTKRKKGDRVPDWTPPPEKRQIVAAPEKPPPYDDPRIAIARKINEGKLEVAPSGYVTRGGKRIAIQKVRRKEAT